MEGFGLIDCMSRYIGHTVTIFTTSGGLSGGGFTGVLIYVDCNCVKLIISIGAAPSCPLGSACMPGYNNCNCSPVDYQCNPFGAVAEIPTCAITSFVHNAI